jgi:hypothetical protein
VSNSNSRCGSDSSSADTHNNSSSSDSGNVSHSSGNGADDDDAGVDNNNMPVATTSACINDDSATGTYCTIYMQYHTYTSIVQVISLILRSSAQLLVIRTSYTSCC